MPKYKLAASNIAWAAEEDEKIYQIMRSLGFDGLEIAPTRLVPNKPYEHIDEARRTCEIIRQHWGLSACSIQSIWYGKTESVFSNDGAQTLLAYTEGACAFAQAIGAHNMVFGCPKNRNAPEGRLAEEIYGFLQSCAKAAAAHETTFAIEANPPMYGTNTFNTTKQVVQAIVDMGHPEGMGINLDLGAIIAQEESLTVVERAIPYASHVHISEPGLVKPERRALHREVRDLLEESSYCGYVSLEMARSGTDSLVASLEYMAEVFG